MLAISWKEIVPTIKIDIRECEKMEELDGQICLKLEVGLRRDKVSGVSVVASTAYKTPGHNRIT